MKNIVVAIKLTAVLIVLLAGVYPLVLWAVAQLSPNAGKGQVLEYNGKTYYAHIGQRFTADGYFWSRPSAVDYNAAGSGASNKGPSNEEYLAEVQARIDTFLMQNPSVEKREVPVDLVTASASGLDPHFSVQAAKVQVARVAKARGMQERELLALIVTQIERPTFGLLGPEKINVLKLNIALDQLGDRQAHVTGHAVTRN